MKTICIPQRLSTNSLILRNGPCSTILALKPHFDSLGAYEKDAANEKISMVIWASTVQFCPKCHLRLQTLLLSQTPICHRADVPHYKILVLKVC